MIPKIFFDQTFRRRNEIELTVDSVILKCAIDAVFTAVSKSILTLKSCIIMYIGLLYFIFLTSLFLYFEYDFT